MSSDDKIINVQKDYHLLLLQNAEIAYQKLDWLHYHPLQSGMSESPGLSIQQPMNCRGLKALIDVTLLRRNIS
ncbi:MAG TPA: hypothetical protein VKA49_16530 [Flavitalea sp.]|nr:hypothetical protein [Flavitalea sp.]